MLQHFHACHHIKTPRTLCSQLFHRNLAVLNIRRTRFQRVQLCNSQGFRSQIHTHHISTFARHGVRQNTSSTPHIQHIFTLQRRMLINPSQTQWINHVQRLELAVHIPPVMCKT